MEIKAIDNLLIDINSYRDSRGILSIARTKGDERIPFEVGRVFWITHVPTEAMRGKHAHKWCCEVVIAVHGGFKVRVSDGAGDTQIYELDSPTQGVLIPPAVWCELYDFTSDAVCLCLASGDYDKEGYMDEFDDFLSYVNSQKRP